jgi:hypothetical protein
VPPPPERALARVDLGGVALLTALARRVGVRLTFKRAKNDTDLGGTEFGGGPGRRALPAFLQMATKAAAGRLLSTTPAISWNRTATPALSGMFSPF